MNRKKQGKQNGVSNFFVLLQPKKNEICYEERFEILGCYF